MATTPTAPMVSVNITVLKGIKTPHKHPLGSGQGLAFSRNIEDPNNAKEAGLHVSQYPPCLVSKKHSRRPVKFRASGKEAVEGIGRESQTLPAWNTFSEDRA